jgi:MYXO-CTERM domain-containing protein
MRSARPSASSRFTAAVRLLAMAFVLAATALAPRAALAAGTVTVANLSPQENDGRWKLQMTINYGSVPHLNHIPMLFIFTPTTLYERTLTDQSPERPILNKIPLQNQQSINESMDVGFADASGKTFAITKFDFVIRRDRGFEAGEYKLEIKRAGDGVRVGNVMTLKLLGDNPVVDRRAMVFAGEKKKEKKAAGTDAAKTSGEATEEKKEEPAEASGETTAEEPAGSGEEGSESGAEPPPVPPKQGGCGCRVGSESSSPLGLLALAIGAVLLAIRARRAS